MSDDKAERGPQDRSRVNVNEHYELRYWSETLGVAEQHLRDAVAAVGTSAEKIREYLRR